MGRGASCDNGWEVCGEGGDLGVASPSTAVLALSSSPPSRECCSGGVSEGLETLGPLTPSPSVLLIQSACHQSRVQVLTKKLRKHTLYRRSALLLSFPGVRIGLVPNLGSSAPTFEMHQTCLLEAHTFLFYQTTTFLSYFLVAKVWWDVQGRQPRHSDRLK